MTRRPAPEWRPLLLGLGGLLVIVVLALGPRAQATDRLFQTVPTPTPQTIPLPTAPITPRPPTRAEEPAPGGALLAHLQISRPDVLPGEEVQFTLYLTNTSPTAARDVVLLAPIDPALLPLELLATQGTAEVKAGSALVYLYTLEAGQTAQVILRARVAEEAQPGQILLLQFTARFAGNQVQSNVVAAALPPDELPPTGDDRR